MTAVYIILGILLLIFLILVIPVKVSFAFVEGVFSFAVWYGFIKVYDSTKPKKEKPKKEKTKKPPAKEVPEKERKEKKKPEILKIFAIKKEELGLMGAVKYFLDVLLEFLKSILWVVRKIRFDRFKLDLVVASEQADSTAINYGYFCSGIYPVLALLSTNANLKLDEVNISADFEKTAIDFGISFRLKTRLIYFLVLGIKLLGQYIKLVKEVKVYERKQDKRTD